jgi:hypothetical protein
MRWTAPARPPGSRSSWAPESGSAGRNRISRCAGYVTRAHPTIEPFTDAAVKVAQPALEHGYAFMSLQYRHPTVSQEWYDKPAAPVNQSVNGAEPPPGVIRPSTDIATAVQWARHHADTLHIDPLNIFLVGQSRGSLAVLTALMGERKKPAAGAGDPNPPNLSPTG